MSKVFVFKWEVEMAPVDSARDHAAKSICVFITEVVLGDHYDLADLTHAIAE